VIYPPAKLGVLGSGQLGRMFTQEALRVGYEVIAYSPEQNTPAGKAGAKEFTGEYTDFLKLENFLKTVQAVTFEFENIPVAALEFLLEFEKSAPPNFFCPSPRTILIAQDRIEEKKYFQRLNLPTVQFLAIHHEEEILPEFPFPAVIKTARFGYDGKGQTLLHSMEDLKQFLKTSPPLQNPYILEEYFPYELEVSVIYARDTYGKEFIFPPVRNIHTHHILNTSEFPAELDPNLQEIAIAMASKLGQSLEYCGVLGLELFISGETILVNEFAPRPHNSGHFSLDGSLISQFGLQLRVLTGQTFPAENQIRHVIMKNILGNDYARAIQVCMNLMQKDCRYKLHLYGKDEAKPGRKMGHINFLGTRKDIDPMILGI